MVHRLKHKFTLMFFVLLHGVLISRAQDIKWAVRSVGSGNEEGRGIVVDRRTGNFYVTGIYTGSPSFGGTTLPTSSSTDIYLIKYSCAGSVIWVRTLNASGDEYVYMRSITVDSSGNVSISGYFQNSLAVQNGSGTTTINSAGSNDIFTASFNANGNLRWVRRAGGTGIDLPLDVKADNSGNIIVTGEFSGTCNFGGINLTSSGGYDGFLLKYDSSGNQLWVVSFSGIGSDLGATLAIDKFNQIYVCGHYGNSGANVTFNTTLGSSVTKSSNGNWDSYVARYSSNGSLRWVQTFNGSNQQEGGPISTDGLNAYVAFNVISSGVLTSASGTNINISANANYDIVCVKYDTLGFVRWSKTYGGSGGDIPRDMVYHNDSIYITGEFSGSINYASRNFTSSGSSDAFINTLDTGGNYRGFYRFGNMYADNSFGISIDTCDKPIFTGRYSDTIYFGSIKLGSNGGTNAFIARFGDKNLQSINFWNNDSVLCTSMPDSIVLTIFSGAGEIAWTRNGTTISINDTFLIVKQAGLYKAYFSDKCCYQDSTRAILINPRTMALNIKDTSKCIGDSLILNTLGNQSYKYSWSPNIDLSDSAIRNPVHYFNQNLSYIITARDSFNCSIQDTAAFSVIVRPPVFAGTDTSLCFSDSIKLSGSGSGNKKWYPNTFMYNDTILTPIVKPLSSITYTLTITAATGCFNSDSVRITLLDRPSIALSSDTAVCLGDSVILYSNGTGKPKWTPNIYISNDSTFSPVFYPPQSKLYHLIVTSANGCKSIDSIQITVNLLPAVNAGPDTMICYGDSIKIGVYSDSTNWWEPDYLLSNNVILNPLTYAKVDTTYVLFTKDKNNCINRDSIRIYVSSLPIINISDTFLKCPNETLSLNTQSNGKIKWIPTTYLDNDTALEPKSITNTNIKYYLRSISSFGCITLDSTQVIVYPKPIIDAGTDTVMCMGDSIFLNGKANGKIQWTANGAILQDSTLNPLIIIKKSTFFYLEVVDQNQCRSKDSVFVMIASLPLFSIGNDTAICKGLSLILKSSEIKPHYQYIWNTGSTDSSISIINGGQYTLRIKDSIGCSSSDTVLITEVEPQKIALAKDTIICGAFQIKLEDINYNKFKFYIWSNGSSESNITVTQNGVFYVSVLDSSNCISTDTINVIKGQNELDLIIPNTFSPNGDAINDFFPGSPGDVDNIELTVYNRWGNIIFASSNGKMVWDGNYNNTESPSGVYYFTIQYMACDNSKRSKSGVIHLFR